MTQFKINVWKICESCTRRNCRLTPSKKGECSKLVKAKSGFPITEMLNKRSDKLK